MVDKPPGWTSHDVVAKVRRLISEVAGKKVKVGHSGTLDPAATGLLILVVGSYTKKAGEFSKLDKTYEAELTLGKVSTTGDSEGQINTYRVVPGVVPDRRPGLQQVQAVLRTFLGEIEQTPPAFSAIKIDGQRAYKMARAGEEVKLEPREVTIYEVSILSYEYPKLRLKTRVSSGTYIRSLAEDIGQKLGTGAYLSALRRTKVGDFDVKDAQQFDELKLNLQK